MIKRKRVESLETEVLQRSGRRCCLCFGLCRDLSVKQGQIAHIDRNPENNEIENLAFLCLVHHDQYDTRNSQSKGWTQDEAKLYRAELYRTVETIRTLGSSEYFMGIAKTLEQFCNEQLAWYANINNKVDQMMNSFQEFK